MVDIWQARDIKKGTNIALFSPKAFQSKHPAELTIWLCQANYHEVGFMSKEGQVSVSFLQQDFCVDNVFPSPAT